MKIVQVHNFYQQPGGEDQVYAAEFELLVQHGHAVRQYSAHNAEVGKTHGFEMVYRPIWNRRTYRQVGDLIREFRPDVVHCHNTFPIISPAIYYAARRAGVPVVQTLHNYRLICPAATLFRDGHVCQDCVGRFIPYDAVLHKCYRGSRAGSAVVASMLAIHRSAQTWNKQISTYIALTEFARTKLVEGGLPARKIAIKPNFLACDPGFGNGAGGFALFVGRLSEEKGLRTLLNAWQELPDLPLKIVGDGPLFEFVNARATELPNVTVSGHRERSQVLEYMRSAALLVMPSEWYEGFPMVAVEAMACGTPVIASDLGSLRELILDGINGGRFAAGNPRDLVRITKEFLAQSSSSEYLRKRTRLCFEEQYTAPRNYSLLIEIYEEAVRRQRDGQTTVTLPETA